LSRRVGEALAAVLERGLSGRVREGRREERNKGRRREEAAVGPGFVQDIIKPANINYPKKLGKNR
jgi:hypothetical protein